MPITCRRRKRPGRQHRWRDVVNPNTAALGLKRKCVGTELNPTYYRQAAQTLTDLERAPAEFDLFADTGT